MRCDEVVAADRVSRGVVDRVLEVAVDRVSGAMAGLVLEAVVRVSEMAMVPGSEVAVGFAVAVGEIAIR